MVLKVDSLSFYYGKRLVLEKIELDLAVGEILALLGPNGSGKSTLLKCINRILKPKEGVVFIDGKSHEFFNEKELARVLGYVPQEHKPPFPFKVLDFVLLGRTPHLGFFSSPGRRDYEKALEALKLVGMEDFAERPYTELSGGERQLVMIARALASEGKILLLDEPTAHLDFRNTHRVLATIKSVVKENGLSAIITLHDPNLAQRYADKVAIICRGRIIAFGKGDEVVNEKTIREAYGIEVEIVNNNGFRFVIPRW